MKKKIVCRKLRSGKIVARNMSNRELGWIKNKIAPKASWYGFGQYLQLARMVADAEIEYINEVMNDTLGDYYENEDGELQPIHDGFEGQERIEARK